MSGTSKVKVTKGVVRHDGTDLVEIGMIAVYFVQQQYQPLGR